MYVSLLYTVAVLRFLRLVWPALVRLFIFGVCLIVSYTDRCDLRDGDGEELLALFYSIMYSNPFDDVR
jgi:hypothetical protein